jgi:RsiW-degrading membrane proteinase PrsW (M82 family)
MNAFLILVSCLLGVFLLLVAVFFLFVLLSRVFNWKIKKGG